MPHASRSDLYQLFLSDTPMLDVRAPVEFEAGAFPGALNVPLMDNEQRHLVGVRFKQAGQESAIRLGRELVSGAIKQARVDRWCRFVDAHPDGVLYCFRGGLRSRISQQWIAETGRDIRRVSGGYRRMRRFLMERNEQLPSALDLLVIGGRTGNGKTALLERLPNSIDLEGLANHRGSGFGRRLDPQPTQIDFENGLAIALMKQVDGPGPVIVEDEARAIGAVHLPPPLHAKMAVSPLVIVDDPLPRRVERVLNEYVIAERDLWIDCHGDHDGRRLHAAQLQSSLDRIRKRLGGVRYTELKKLMARAFEGDDHDLHRQWITKLVRDYYDPMYNYQLSRNTRQVVFSGDFGEVADYLSTRTMT